MPNRKHSMSSRISDPTILLPVDASDHDSGEPSASLVELLSPHSVVVLGYYPVPDQSGTDQLRSQFGEQARKELDEIAERFSEAGAATESVLVFTKDRSETIGRVAAEHDVDAVFAADKATERMRPLERILVPIRGDENLRQILGFLEALTEESDADVTFFNVAGSDEEVEPGELLVRGARDRLIEAGIDPDRIEWRQTRDDAPGSAIADVAGAFDLLVVGEAEPSLRERIFGRVTDEVVESAPEPVLIVRHRPEE